VLVHPRRGGGVSNGSLKVDDEDKGTPIPAGQRKGHHLFHPLSYSACEHDRQTKRWNYNNMYYHNVSLIYSVTCVMLNIQKIPQQCFF